MKQRSTWFWVAVLGLVVAGAGYYFYPRSSAPQRVAGRDGISPDVSANMNTSGDLGARGNRPGSAPQDKTTPSSHAAYAPEAQARANPGDPQHGVVSYGRTPPVKPDANPNVKSVAEALQTKTHPERLTAMVAPKPFNKDEYKKNPQAYLDVVEPGRVYQSAQPGPGVPVLQPAGSRYAMLVQGKSTTLSIKALPGVPVTFTSFDLGRFENQLTSITVAADASGVAKTQFLATPGTINAVRILAGSPLATGQVEFLVDVQLPAKAQG